MIDKEKLISIISSRLFGYCEDNWYGDGDLLTSNGIENAAWLLAEDIIRGEITPIYKIKKEKEEVYEDDLGNTIHDILFEFVDSQERYFGGGLMINENNCDDICEEIREAIMNSLEEIINELENK